MIRCEWRLFVAPDSDCSYALHARQIHLAAFAFYVFGFVMLTIMVTVRKFYLKYRFWRTNAPMFWMKIYPTETFFFASWFMLASVALTFFLCFGNGVGLDSVIYFWIALVTALPSKNLVDSSNILPRLTSITIIRGFTLMGLIFLTPILNALSGYYTTITFLVIIP